MQISIADLPSGNDFGEWRGESEVVGFGKMLKWIEGCRRVIAQVMMQRRFPHSPGDSHSDFGIAQSIPSGIEIDRGRQFRGVALDPLQIMLEDAVMPHRRDVGCVEIRQIDDRVEQYMSDTVFMGAVPQVM